MIYQFNFLFKIKYVWLFKKIYLRVSSLAKGFWSILRQFRGRQNGPQKLVARKADLWSMTFYGKIHLNEDGSKWNVNWSGTVLFQGQWYDFFFIVLGFCVIFNNETFANANTHPTRNGTNADRGMFTRKSVKWLIYSIIFFGGGDIYALRRKVKHKKYCNCNFGV